MAPVKIEERIEQQVEHVERTNRFLRGSAYVAVILGAVQVIVRIVGDIALWIVAVVNAQAGRPAVEMPGLPWSYWSSVAGFVVLSLLGAAFWRGQIGEPGRVIDLMLGWIPRRRGGGEA